MSDVTIIVSIVWGIPLLLFVFYYVGERMCRIDIEIKPKEKKKRTRFWLHRRRLYRKVRRFFYQYSVFRPSVVFLLLQGSKQTYQDSVFARAKRLEQVGYSVRIVKSIESERYGCLGFLQIYGKPQPTLGAL